MYELNRARLVGIGPRSARYSDVTLDLSGLGEPIPSQNLFDQPTHRPAAFSLLLLENGGGKSVLLKLLFSVVLPGRRNTVGGVALDNFVLDGDTGHVALEWMHVRTGERLVTAKVYQRRARAAGHKDQVAEAWYSFRPSQAISLDLLPVVVDGRRRRLDGFREAVEEADRLDATTELSWLGDDQGRWRIHLRERGIEPDLFDIQRRMNVDEGEAAKAFKYSSSQDFVDWLLTTVTDPQDAASVAETFGRWAANLADREQMLLERDFLVGVIAGLDPLADAYTARQQAARHADGAVRAAEVLTVALGHRLRSEKENTAQLGRELEEARTVVVARSSERDAARALLNEIRRQTFQLEFEEAKASQASTKEELAVAELELYGWEAIPAIEEHRRAIATANELAIAVAAADKTAAPTLARRDETAGRLLAKYLAEADANDREADGHDGKVTAAKQEASDADAQRSAALGEAAVARERCRAAERTVAEVTKRVAAEAAAALVPVETTLVQVSDLAEAARSFHAGVSSRLGKLKEAATQAALNLKEVDDTVTGLQKSFHLMAVGAQKAAGSLQGVEDEAVRLGRITVLVDAAGADPDSDAAKGAADDAGSHVALSVDALEKAADRLLGHLARDIDDHTEYLDELRAAQREGARVAEALGTGGLLPPRMEVERALEVLHLDGIVAYAGWRYLYEAVPADERSDLIAAHPALADGVVLVEAEKLTHAQQLLSDARLLPAAAVAVGSGAALLNLRPPAPTHDHAEDQITIDVADECFVVEPTPALYDEESAAVRREELQEQMMRRGALLLAGGEQLKTVTAARNDLDRWRCANPPGQLASLREAAAVARGREDAAREQLDAAKERLELAIAEHELADVAVEQATRDERRAADRAARVETLATLVESALRAQQVLPDCMAEMHRGESSAAAAFRLREQAEQAQVEYARLAEQARGRAERQRAACEDVPSTSGQPSDAVPAEALADLRVIAAAAQQAYLNAAVDQELRRQASEASEKVQSLRTALALRNSAHVAEAERLRATSLGTDRTSWSVGASNARRAVAALQLKADRIANNTGRLEASVQAASPTEPGRRTWTSLSGRWQPTSPEHGRVLQAKAQEESRKAQSHLDGATGTVVEFERQRKAADDAARGVNEAYLPLITLMGTIPDGVTAAPYADDVIMAQQAATAAVTRLRETAERLASSESVLAGAIHDLVSHANLARYESLTTQARRSILESSRENLAARAADWSASLLARLATLTSDLDNANRYRKAIVDRLSALVDQAVRTLRQASKLSRLPDDLAEWGGRPFLRISFAEPDQSSIWIRVGEVVDRVAGEYSSRAVGGKVRNARRDGMALLLQAVHAAVPKGFVADVLKPDSVLRDERVSIEEMNKIFSGGQELTAAIVLYCTLAALSANERGKLRSRYSGVLFLDNPIGRANASYLIDLQQSVARALGVQLVYTTGISDDRVLAAFPLWVRLRNDADLRAGLKYIQVAEVVRRQLPPPYSDDELISDTTDGTSNGGKTAPGTVTSTRVYRRQVETNPRSSLGTGDLVVPA